MLPNIIIEAKHLIKTEGVAFKLDDLAKNLRISKKTIYKYISGKEEILKTIILDTTDEVKRKQKIIIESDMEILDKITSLLRIIPVDSELFTNNNMKSLETYYPELSNLVNDLFSKDWYKTFKLMDIAVKEGKLEPYNKGLFKHIYIEGLLHRYVENISYEKRIDEIINILFKGVIKR